MERHHLNKRSEDSVSQRLFIQNFNFTGSELGFRFREVIRPPELEDGTVTENYWEHPENKDEAFKVDIYEMDSFETATNLMQTILTSHMIPNLPEWENNEIKPGEVAFGSTGHVVFTRANLVIIINSIGQRDIDVSPHAKELDKIFTLLPDIPVAEDRSGFSSLEVTRNEQGRLLINIGSGRSTAQTGVWFKFVTERGSIRRLKGGQLITTEESALAGVMMYAFVGSNAVEKRQFKM